MAGEELAREAGERVQGERAAGERARAHPRGAARALAVPARFFARAVRAAGAVACGAGLLLVAPGPATAEQWIELRWTQPGDVPDWWSFYRNGELIATRSTLAYSFCDFDSVLDLCPCGEEPIGECVYHHYFQGGEAGDYHMTASVIRWIEQPTDESDGVFEVLESDESNHKLKELVALPEPSGTLMIVLGIVAIAVGRQLQRA